MTRNYPLFEMQTENVGGFHKPTGEKYMHQCGIEMDKTTTDFKILTQLDWVSHGNYAIIQDWPERKEGDIRRRPYISLEKEHFQQILDAWENEKGHPYLPAWRGVVPARGLCMWEDYMFAYFYKDKDAILIECRSSNMFANNLLSSHVTQVILKHSEFKELSMHLNDKEKPYHCFDIKTGSIHMQIPEN